MNDAPAAQGFLERTEQWVSASAREAYNHPGQHLPEIVGAALMLGSTAVLAKSAVSQLLRAEGMAAKDFALERAGSMLVSLPSAREIAGPLIREADFVGRRIGSTPITRSLGDASEYQLQGLPAGQTHAEQIASLKQLAQHVDYRNILPSDSKVAVFGESHTVDEVRAELGKHMPEFKKLGFTHLAMEALPSARQGLIDNYYAGKATAAEVRKAIAKDWGWSPGSYMYLIDTARENGIKVIAADSRFAIGGDPGSDVLEKFATKDQMREGQWARLISNAIKDDPSARVMLLAGKAHTLIDPQLERLTTMLSRLKPTVVEYSAGWQEADVREDFDESVAAAGLASKRFMVRLTGSAPARPADVFVHLPSLYGG